MTSEATCWAVGIDPGISGGIAAVNLDRSAYYVKPMPVLDRRVDTLALQDFFEELNGKISLCMIEKAQPMPRQGVVATFTMGMNYGILLSFLLNRMPFSEITPAEWKRAIVGVRSSRQKTPTVGATMIAHVDKKQSKEMSVAEARKLFPAVTIKKTQDGLAEALLIAEMARRTVVGSKEN